MGELMRLAAVILLLCIPAAQSAAQDNQHEHAQSEIAAAKANNPLVKSSPEWLAGPDAEFPESLKALGHNGGVFVHGVLGKDGRLSHVAVRDSSGSPELDAIALKAATEESYRPARDANGDPIAVFFGTEFRFDNYRSSEGVGAAKYLCRQFVLDMDWWKQAHAELTFSNHQFYTMMRGLGGVARMKQGVDPMKALTTENKESFNARWDKAIEDCRTDPAARFADKMKPEGDYILQLEKNFRR
jgi:TonB family protein